jgi:hypothetical protein
MQPSGAAPRNELLKILGVGFGVLLTPAWSNNL